MQTAPLRFTCLFVLLLFTGLLGFQGYLSLTSLFEPQSIGVLCMVAAALMGLAFIAGIATFKSTGKLRWAPLFLTILGSLAFLVRVFLLGMPDDFISVAGAIVTALLIAVPTIGSGFFLGLPPVPRQQ